MMGATFLSQLDLPTFLSSLSSCLLSSGPGFISLASLSNSSKQKLDCISMFFQPTKFSRVDFRESYKEELVRLHPQTYTFIL